MVLWPFLERWRVERERERVCVCVRERERGTKINGKGIIITSRKPVRCTGKLLKIRSKEI